MAVAPRGRKKAVAAGQPASSLGSWIQHACQQQQRPPPPHSPKAAIAGPGPPPTHNHCWARPSPPPPLPRPPQPSRIRYSQLPRSHGRRLASLLLCGARAPERRARARHVGTCRHGALPRLLARRAVEVVGLLGRGVPELLPAVRQGGPHARAEALNQVLHAGGGPARSMGWGGAGARDRTQGG